MVAAFLARCTFPPTGTPVTCAVSGGPDSSALAVLAVAAGCPTTLVHVDHRLRDGSAEEGELVARLAVRLGCQWRLESVEVGAGPNLEARAREARYAILPPDVVTGHTADDQAETVLLNLLRGSSLHGLAAMRPGHRRPLLGLRRHETHTLCTALGVDTVDDPSNHSPTHLRNRVRLELMPLLAAAADRDLVPVLIRQADLARADSDLLDEWAARLDPTDARALVAAPLALARRAVRRWLAGGGYPPDAAAVERVLSVARGEAIAAEVGGGRRVERHRQRLSLHPSLSPSADRPPSD